VDVYSRSYLDVGIGCSGSFEVLFAVMLAGIQLDLLDSLVAVDCAVLLKVVVARDEVVELFKIFQG
jgi:hypothetical protein